MITSMSNFFFFFFLAKRENWKQIIPFQCRGRVHEEYWDENWSSLSSSSRHRCDSSWPPWPFPAKPPSWPRQPEPSRAHSFHYPTPETRFAGRHWSHQNRAGTHRTCWNNRTHVGNSSWERTKPCKVSIFSFSFSSSSSLSSLFHSVLRALCSSGEE